MDFKEYNSKGSYVWTHFLRTADGKEAKCKMCQGVFKISGSTSSLHKHLKNVHGKTGQTSTSIEAGDGTASQKEHEETATKKRKVTDYFQSQDSIQLVIARMVCLDGLPFKFFCSSEDIKKLLRKSGYKNVPSAPNTVKNMVMKVYEEQKLNLKMEIIQLKQENRKFSLTLDEWTAVNNHRYINLNIHCSYFKNSKKFHNLGLIRIIGSMPADVCIDLIRQRLLSFNIYLTDSELDQSSSDVLAMTTDGASVMLKVGKLLPIFHQVCLAHGIHLGITEVLYKKDEALPESLYYSQEECSDSDSDVEDGEFIIERAGAANPLIRDFQNVIKKVRSVVLLFKRSPTKNDSYLQKYVIQEFGTELKLLLDCKTRWSSIEIMLERFIKLKTCVQKALLDLRSSIFFSDEEFGLLKDLQYSLNIVKVTVEALCRCDATLITADTALKLMIKSLDSNNSLISKRISNALKTRIKERRLHSITGTLLYLHNPVEFMKQSDEVEDDEDDVFLKPSFTEINQVVCKTVKSQTSNSSMTPTIEIDDENIENLSFKQRLDKELNRLNNFNNTIQQPNTDISSLISVEMALYNDKGTRGRYLEAAYRQLLCIPPTSVESERVFSAAGILCSRIRSRLSDTTLDALIFLRHNLKL